MGEAEFQAQLALAKRIEEQLEMAVPALEQKNEASERPVFNIGIEEGQAMSGCSKGERPFLQWVLSSANSILTHRNGSDGMAALEALRTLLLSAEPKSAIESLLVCELAMSHELATSFGRRAVECRDSNVAAKLANQYIRLVEMVAKQAETLQKLQGKLCKQTIAVEHLTVESGARAVVGQQVHAAVNPTREGS